MTRYCRWRSAIAILLLGATTSATALNTLTISKSALSPQCTDYRVVGLCYWLFCTPFGCTVLTSVKVRHYIPEAVVSSYANTGQNPWNEVALMSVPNPTAQAGGDGTTNHDSENNLAKFKNADVIGHPGAALYSKYISKFGYTCPGASTPMVPYLLSTLDTVAWRYNLPESLYPEALVPGLRDIGSRASLNLWGNLYPRGGFLHQADDYKAAAVIAQRAGNVITKRGQIHVYQPMLASPYPGYWPAGELVESDIKTGKWQELLPRMTNTCAVFPNNTPTMQANRGDYIWALWRPYSCCQRRGQVLLYSIDF